MSKNFARPYKERLAPSRPSNTEDVNARASYEHTVLDYATTEQQPAPTGFVPSAPDPVPVYIVQDAPPRRGIVRRVTGNITIAASQRQQICGADTRRKRVFIRNLDSTNNVWVVPDATTISIGGFILEPGQHYEAFDTESVWLLTGAASADVTWLIEFEVDE